MRFRVNSRPGSQAPKRIEGLGRAIGISVGVVAVALLMCLPLSVLVRESIGQAIYCGLLLTLGFALAGYLIPTPSMSHPFTFGLLGLVVSLLATIALSPLVQALGGPMDASTYAVGSWPFLVPGIVGLLLGHRRLLKE